MVDEKRKVEATEVEPRGLPQEELEAEAGEMLPERQEMALIDANVAAPVNAAVAANVLSDGSIAYADATQTSDITQQLSDSSTTTVDPNLGL
jgi:hypothetical protein